MGFFLVLKRKCVPYDVRKYLSCPVFSEVRLDRKLLGALQC